MRACEHGDHPCPEGRIFCSIACEACELADCPAGEECAGVCNRSETNMTNTMQFGAALALAKIGHRIAREGWNGKGMFVAYMPPVVIPAEKVNERTRRFVPEGDLNVGGYFVLKTAQGMWQPGWLASQNDMLANDWIDLDESEGVL